MKKIYPALLFLMLFAGAVSGQELTLKQLDSVARKINTYSKIDTVYVNMRLDYVRNKLFLAPTDSSVIGHCLRSMELSEKIKYDKGIALSHLRLGVAYNQLRSDADNAVKHYKAALRIIDANPKLKEYRFGAVYNIATVLYEQKEFDNAIKYYKKSVEGGPEKFHVYSGIANVFGSLGRGDSAEYYYKKSIVLSKKENATIYTANDLSNLSLVYVGMKEYAKAKTAIDESLSLIDRHSLEYIRGIAYVNAAMVYKATQDYSKAEKYALDALKLHTALDNLFTQKSIWGTLAEIYEAQNKHDKALSAYKKYMAASDTLQSQDRKVETTRSLMQYESDKKQALSGAEIERQKIIKLGTIGTSSVVMLSGVFLFIGFRNRQRIRQTQSELLLRAKISDVELKALRLQMNPHFIFNSLNSIGDYIQKNDTQKADYYLTKFAKLMRGILENSEEKEITIAAEIRLLELYMQLEASRLNDKFIYEFKIDKSIDIENTFIPPLILQPFVENSIWHGMNGKHGEGKIVIEITKEDTMLNFAVQDDGVGRAAGNPGERKSYGLKITKDRLEVLNKLKNTNASVNLIDLETGTRVEVKLPIESDNI